MPYTGDDPTTNFGWDLPAQDGDEDTWGDASDTANPDEGLDVILEAIDAAAKVEDDAAAAVTTSVADLTTRTAALESGQFVPAYGILVMAGDYPAIPHAVATAIDFTTATGYLSEAGTDIYDPSGFPTRLTVPDGSDGPYGNDGRFNLSGLYNVRASVEMPSHAGSDDTYGWTISLRKNGSDTIATRKLPKLNAGGSENDPIGGGGSWGTTTAPNRVVLTVETFDVGAVGDYYEVLLTSASGGTSQPGTETVIAASFAIVRYPSPRASVARVLYSAGLDVHGGSSADFDRYTVASLVGAPTIDWDDNAGVYGGGALSQQDAALKQSILEHTFLGTGVAGGIASFYIRAPLAGGAGPIGDFFRVQSGSTTQFALHCTNAAPGVILAKTGEDGAGTTIATGTANLDTDGTYNHVEVQWTLSDGTSSVLKVWVDGTLVIDVSGGALGSGEAWDGYGRESNIVPDGFVIDDFVIQSALGTRLDVDHRIWTVSPDGDGPTNEWFPNGGVDHYARVDDTDPDRTSTVLNSELASARAEFTYTLPAITGAIREVIVKGLVNPDADEAIHLGLRIDGDEILSEELYAHIGGVSEFGEFSFAIGGPPAGGSWSVANLTDGVILLESTENNTSCVATQIWLEILTTG